MDSRTLTDAAALKALAHPLRMDLLESLLIEGPGNATELAHRVGNSPSNCSWHLRKLAEHGFVSEVEGATGRSRPWKATSEGVSWGKAHAEPEVAQAGHGLTDMLLTRELQRLRAAQAVEHLEPPEWREASTVVQSVLWLTAEEAEEISQELRALLMRHFDRMSHPERRPEGARLVSTVAWLSPRPETSRGDGEQESR